MKSIWRKRIKLLLLGILLGLICVASYLIYDEMQSSKLQARYLTKLGTELKFKVEPGASQAIHFPQSGPSDERLGYSQIPEFTKRLLAHDFVITDQVRMSERMFDLTGRGLFAPYQEKGQTGFNLFDCNNKPLYGARFPERVYDRFESIPRLLVDSLLFIENRELLDTKYATKNPAIEWERFSKAILDQAWGLVNPGHNSPGGSTLATQIEKYRHSPDGRTTSGREKLRQMASASVRVYLNGEETLPTRRQIVIDYLNSVPLSAKFGYGEVNGLGDGLWAWYGRDFTEINRLLKDGIDSEGRAEDRARRKAEAFKQALSLMIAQRRPSYYLGDGAEDLQQLTDSYLRVMGSSGFIPPSLRDAALPIKLKLREEPPVQPPVSFVTRKASTIIRTQLAGLLNVPRLYDVDRLDLGVSSTLNADIQRGATDLLRQVKDPASAKAAGLYGFRLFSENDDPSKVIFSFVLFERGQDGNYLRVQSDNLDQPFDINQGTKLDLGSTAKLRTLITYLDIIAALHRQYASMTPEELADIEVQKRDALTRWSIDYLTKTEDKALRPMLEAALDRNYSASPAESFFTGGGVHTFENFDHEDDHKVMPVRDALRKSVNLVFIRLMRDVVWHYMYQSSDSMANKLLENSNDPRRKEYLSRFADKEGREFITRFYRKYQGKTPVEAEELLLSSIRPVTRRFATVFRTIYPDAGLPQFSTFMRDRLPGHPLSDKVMRDLYERYGPEKYSLADRGYIAGIHPLELWLAGFVRQHPGSTLGQVIEASRDQRQEVYVWLFKTGRRNAQDSRIQSLVEIEAFLEVNRAWRRLGYPFESFTSSYAASIGAAGDRPAALAELMGIIVNRGMRMPTIRMNALHFAAGTPYETRFQQHAAKGERVLPEEVADAVRNAVLGVVEDGTAKRISGAFTKADGTKIEIGGKTGTGDHRFDVYAAGGRLVSSRVVSRSATFVFLIGDRYYGTMTAYAQEPYAAKFKFTSALSVQLLKTLAPTLMPLIDGGSDGKPIACQH
ncbi:MAG: transglycosylase domain-containing protein [Pseudomonadota bacterium]